jgi:hypothetical protein
MALPSVRQPTPYLWQRRNPEKCSDLIRLNCLSTCGPSFETNCSRWRASGCAPSSTMELRLSHRISLHPRLSTTSDSGGNQSRSHRSNPPLHPHQILQIRRLPRVFSVLHSNSAFTPARFHHANPQISRRSARTARPRNQSQCPARLL